MTLNTDFIQTNKTLSKKELKVSFDEKTSLFIDANDIVKVMQDILIDHNVYIEVDQFSDLNYELQEKLDSVMNESFKMIIDEMVKLNIIKTK